MRPQCRATASAQPRIGMLTLALNEDLLVSAVPAYRAVSPRIVGARSSPIPLSAYVSSDCSFGENVPYVPE